MKFVHGHCMFALPHRDFNSTSSHRRRRFGPARKLIDLNSPAVRPFSKLNLFFIQYQRKTLKRDTWWMFNLL